jgi:hypothetical protein
MVPVTFTVHLSLVMTPALLIVNPFVTLEDPDPPVSTASVPSQVMFKYQVGVLPLFLIAVLGLLLLKLTIVFLKKSIIVLVLLSVWQPHVKVIIMGQIIGTILSVT